MNSFAGIGLKVLSTFLFAGMTAIIKHVSDIVPTGEIIFSRCFFALIPLFVMGLMQRNLIECVVTAKPWLHVRRAIVGATAMTCWFLALRSLPLPEATAISFAAPLMLVVLAAVFLKETVRLYRWSAVLLGFVGVLIIIYPRLSALEAGTGAAIENDLEMLGMLFAIAATVLIAIASALVRDMTRSEKNAAIIFYFFVATSLFSLVSLYWGWVLPDWDIVALLVLSGIFGGTAQIAMTQALRVSEASLLAPFDYVNMVWAILMGIFLFGEYPTFPVLLGGSIVVVAGMFVVFRERQLGLARKAEARVREL